MTPQDTVSHRKLVNKQVRRGEPSEITSKCTCTFNLQVRRWVVFADVSGFELAGVSHPLSVLANLEAALVFATRASIFVILIEIALNLQFQWSLSHLKLYGAMFKLGA